MTRYDELLAELQKLAKEQDEGANNVDPSHALQRVAHLELLVVGLAWVVNQALKELAKRETPNVELSGHQRPARKDEE